MSCVSNIFLCFPLYCMIIYILFFYALIYFFIYSSCVINGFNKDLICCIFIIFMIVIGQETRLFTLMLPLFSLSFRLIYGLFQNAACIIGYVNIPNFGSWVLTYDCHQCILFKFTPYTMLEFEFFLYKYINWYSIFAMQCTKTVRGSWKCITSLMIYM